MPTLLAIIARTIAPLAPGAVLADSLEDMVGAMWADWTVGPADREAELLDVARASPDELTARLDELVGTPLPPLPAETQRRVRCYLLLVCAEIRYRGSIAAGERLAALPASPADLLTFLPPRLPLFCPGDRPLAVADWELDMLLGLGGFGEVWKARNARFAGVSAVALKFCLDPTARQRLLGHEAELLNRVMRAGKHPGIVQLQNTYLVLRHSCKLG